MQGKIENYELSPSFSCYSSDSLTTSIAISKAIREDEDFEFALPLSHQQASPKEINSQSWPLFPLFNRDLQVYDVENDANSDSSIISGPLQKLFIDEQRQGSDESPSYSSSEADELEDVPSGTFCVWSPKASSSSPKCKKSNSTGSSSKKWTIRYLLKRSNSEGKEPMVLLNPKHKQNPVEVSKVGRRLKAQTPVHELFYVQRRAEYEVGKKKTYLPYRKDLVGLF